MEHVVVTGGAGFVGSHLVAALIRADYKVSVIDNLSTGQKKYVPRFCKFYKLDVRSPKLGALLKKIKPDYVCHLAAQVSVPDSVREAANDAAINIVGTINLLEAIKNINLKKFLLVSSAAVYGQPALIPTPEEAPREPLSPYAWSKKTAEDYLLYYESNYGLPWVVVRPSNIYGPRQKVKGETGVIAIFVNNFVTNQPLIIESKGFQTRDFIFVTDVVQGMVAALQKGRGVYNLSSNQEVAIRDVVRALGELSLTMPPLDYVAPRDNDITRSSLDNSKALRELKWQISTPLLEGLRQTVKRGCLICRPLL